MSAYRSQLENYVRMCDRHILQGRATIAQQRETIVRMVAGGHQTHTAEALLLSFLSTQRLHEEHRDRLLRLLEAA